MANVAMRLPPNIQRNRPVILLNGKWIRPDGINFLNLRSPLDLASYRDLAEPSHVSYRIDSEVVEYRLAKDGFIIDIRPRTGRLVYKITTKGKAIAAKRMPTC